MTPPFPLKFKVAEPMLKLGSEIKFLSLKNELAVKEIHICQIPKLYLCFQTVKDNLLILKNFLSKFTKHHFSLPYL